MSDSSGPGTTPLRLLLGVVLLWLGASGPSLAAGKIRAGIEPVYTACLSAPSSCRNVARMQFRVQYTLFAVRGFSARIRLLRAYQMTLDDDKDDGSSEEQQASKFDPPYDVIDVKLRFTEPNGRDRLEVRTGYAYQHSDPSTADGYHAVYASADYYFGGAIPSGTGGLTRRFDVTTKVSQNVYAAAGRSPEQLAQFVGTYTVPLNNDASTRMYASYARELRFSGSNAARTPSNRFDLGTYRTASRWLEFYARLTLFGTRGVPGTAKFVMGADIAI